MFSPSQNGSAPPSTARTSRRRPRPSGDSIAPPKAKRQRSALTDATFTAPSGATEMEEVKSQKLAMVKQDNNLDTSSLGREIAVRGGKKSRSADRSSKGDGSVVLTTNDTYTVSKLPALPDRLRKDVVGRQHGAIYSDSGYALTLTHTHAIVWPYAVNVQSPETFTFALPAPSKHTSDPLPIGCLVSASASSSDPGLVVVIPTTGKVTYWESISSAATLDLRLQRNGVDITIQGMIHGESVIDVLNAESAGFVLAFSTGRLAYMSVRDGQGRPAISVQFLRNNSGPAKGGIFGSLRNALSASAWRGDIAAIRAGRPERVGERSIVCATSTGKLQHWNIQRGGHASINIEVESRELIVMAIKHTSPVLSALLLETFELHDFTYPPKSIIDDDQNDDIHLLLLTSMTDQEVVHYFLVEVVLKNHNIGIGSIRPVKSYQSKVNTAATAKPRLFLPNPALVAYIVFDKAAIVLSMAKQPNSPETQLRTESYLSPLSFEDVVDFKSDIGVEIVGSGMEELQGASQGIEDSKSRRHKAKHPAVVLMVRGGGIVRVAATDTSRLTSSKAQQVTAKSKLEQAVFFGTIDQNLLNFAVRKETKFSPQEVGEAALQLSLDILKSETPYIPSVPASIEQNLKKRCKALHDLAQHLKSTEVELDRVTKWQLLWCAEKAKAASAMWESYDATLKHKSVGQKRNILTEVVEFVHEQYKTEPVPEAGELDRVRHWFIKDVWNLEIALAWVFQVIKYTYQDGNRGHDGLSVLASEGNDMVLRALQSAFKFRSDNLDLYGLGDEVLSQGVLDSDCYKGLPEFWTSNIFITENIRKQTELAGVLSKTFLKHGEVDKGQQPSAQVVEKLRRELPALLDLTIRANRERIGWIGGQDDPNLQLEAERLESALSNAQQITIRLIADDLELPDEAADLAERHGLLNNLAWTLTFDLGQCTAIAYDRNTSKEDRREAAERHKDVKQRVQRCFRKFGSPFATSLFELDIQNQNMTDLLDGWPEQQEYLTAFLRSKPNYAKISWINDLTEERDASQASQALLDLGLHREDDLWSKQVELSMGKLALLATKSYSESNGILMPNGSQIELATVHSQLDLIKIQEAIYAFLGPSISSAIDEKAELQLAMEALNNNKLIVRQPRLFTHLEESMAQLLRHQAMGPWSLIDLLTLIGGDGATDELMSLHGQRFYLALRAVRSGLTRQDDQILAQRIIWRRCMLHDNWGAINDTVNKNDTEVSDQLLRTALYQTFGLCITEKLFDENSIIHPMSPEEVWGAGSDKVDSRFRVSDRTVQEQIMREMSVEDDALRPLIESCRLEKWYESALDRARSDCATYIHEQTDEGGVMMKQAKDKLAEIEERIKVAESQKAETLLRSKPRFVPKPKANGKLVDFRSSYKA